MKYFTTFPNFHLYHNIHVRSKKKILLLSKVHAKWGHAQIYGDPCKQEGRKFNFARTLFLLCSRKRRRLEHSTAGWFFSAELLSLLWSFQRTPLYRVTIKCIQKSSFSCKCQFVYYKNIHLSRLLYPKRHCPYGFLCSLLFLKCTCHIYDTYLSRSMICFFKESVVESYLFWQKTISTTYA